MTKNSNNQYTDTPITILFDLDGTLIDSTEAILESFARTFELLGGSMPSREAIESQIGHPLSEMYRRLEVPEDRIEEYVRSYKEHYRTIHTKKTVLIPGAREAVLRASEFARLGVVTTKTGKYSRELLEHFGLMESFDVLIGSENVRRHKPHPEPIEKALARMGSLRELCWMIGDTCMDVEAAKAAGVRPLALSCGYGLEERLRECGAPVFPGPMEAVETLAKNRKSTGNSRAV